VLNVIVTASVPGRSSPASTPARGRFAAEAARLASGRTVPDEALAEVASRHLLRMAGDG